MSTMDQPAGLLYKLLTFSFIILTSFISLAESPHLKWCSYLGGNGLDSVQTLVPSATPDTFYAIGWTTSDDFPALKNSAKTSKSNQEIFIALVETDGSLEKTVLFGGKDADEIGGAAVDKNGNLFIAGQTESSDIPNYPQVSPTQQNSGGVFVSKFDPALNLQWTYFICSEKKEKKSSNFAFSFGINDVGQVSSIAADSEGNTVIVGYTDDWNFPVLNPLDSEDGGITEGFVFKLNSQGHLLWSTLLGGCDFDYVNDIAFDSKNNIYVCGYTKSSDFPIKSGGDKTFNGEEDAFLAKISPEGQLIWSTFLGGKRNDQALALVIGQRDDLYVGGSTNSSNFPIKDGFQCKLNNPSSMMEKVLDGLVLVAGGEPATDGFLSKISVEGKLIWSTYLGGWSKDEITTLAIDRKNRVLIGGNTESYEFPANSKSGIIKISSGTIYGNVFISKITSEGDLCWSAYLSGDKRDRCFDILTSGDNHFFLAGTTSSNDLPVFGGDDMVFKSPGSAMESEEGYIAKVSTNTSLGSSTGFLPNIEFEKTVTPCFTPHTLSTFFPAPYTVITSDMDGDGDMDIVCSSNESEGHLLLYENQNTTPTAFTTRSIVKSENRITEMAPVDYDLDGDIDLVCCSHYDFLDWYENTGKKPVCFSHHSISKKHEGSSMAVADFNSDQYPDILSTEVPGIVFRTKYQQMIYFNTGKAKIDFDPYVVSESKDSTLYFAADLDGDSDPDVVLYDEEEQTFCAHENRLNTKQGFFSYPIEKGSYQIGYINGADLDSDGDTDLLAVSEFSNHLVWFENNENGSIAFSEHIISTSGEDRSKFTSADFDGDGDIDILTSCPLENTLTWWENSGGSYPTFTPKIITKTANNIFSISTADFDADGDEDIVASHCGEDKVVWYENKINEYLPGATSSRVKP